LTERPDLPRSDLSGREISPGTGGVVRIEWGKPSKEPLELKLTAEEVNRLVGWAEKGSSKIVLKHGKRSVLSGKAIPQASGGTLTLTYESEDGPKTLVLELTNDELRSLTGSDWFPRSKQALSLAVLGALAALILAGVITSGFVTRYPVTTLVIVTAVTITVATMFWQYVEKVSSRAAVIASGIGVVLTALFAIVPNLAPETSTSLKMLPMTLERGVSLREYLTDPSIRYRLRCEANPRCTEYLDDLTSSYCALVRIRSDTPIGQSNEAACLPPREQSLVLYVPVESVGSRSRTSG
jgi:hypothetical protein